MELLYEMLTLDTLGFTLKQCRENEGFHPTVYLDSADPPVRTIGIGHTGFDEALTHLTESEALDMLDNDLRKSAEDIAFLVPTWQALSQVRRAVLILMAFNLGRARLGKFKNTLKAIAVGDSRAVAHHMLDSVWSGDPPRGVGPRAFELASEYRLDRWMMCEIRWN